MWVFGFSTMNFLISNCWFLGLISLVDIIEVPLTKNPLAYGPPVHRSVRMNKMKTVNIRAKATERQNWKAGENSEKSCTVSYRLTQMQNSRKKT